MHESQGQPLFECDPHCMHESQGQPLGPELPPESWKAAYAAGREEGRQEAAAEFAAEVVPEIERLVLTGLYELNERYDDMFLGLW